MARRRGNRRTINDAPLSRQIEQYFKNNDDALYADALITLLARSNTIITGREIQCALSDSVSVAATDGSTVFFNVGNIASLIRGLRITKRIPTKVEYDEAINQIQRKNWSNEQRWHEGYAWRQATINQNYLYRKFTELPHLFPQPICVGELNHNGCCFSQPLPYESFVAKLQVSEMSQAIRSFATLRGLNYHELSHCLFTPSANASLRKQILELGNDRIYRVGLDCGIREFFKLLGIQKPKDEELNRWASQTGSVQEAYRIAITGAFWHKIWNTLEDQRIESLFVAKFPTARHFFTTAVLRYIASYKPTDFGGSLRRTERKEGASYLLLHGRRYLRKSLRLQYRNLLQQQFNLDDATITEGEALIDKFRGLSSFKTQADIAIALDTVFEFGIWVLKNVPDVYQIPEPEGGFDHQQHGKNGGSKNNDGKRDIENAQDKRRELEDRWDEEEDSDDYGDSSDDSSDEADDDSDDDDSQGEDSDDQGSDDDSDSDTDGKGDLQGDSDSDSDDAPAGNKRASDKAGSDSKSQNGNGTTASVGNGATPSKELRELLKQAEEAIAEDAVRQIQTLHETVKQTRFSRFFSNLHKSDKTVATPVLFRSLANAISTALSKLRSDRDNQWERGSSVGVVNALRYAEARGTHTDFFDEWQEDGDERPDAEIVVLLDLSGSMNSTSFTQAVKHYAKKDTISVVGNALSSDLEANGINSNAYEASCAMWAIKYACQRNDILCSVIGYSDSALALYGSDDTVTSGGTALFCGIGGTQPKEALFYARSVLERSDAKHKILVSLSDGEWAIDRDGLLQVNAIRKFGGQTVFIQLPSSLDGDGNGGFKPVYSRQGDKFVTAKGEFYCHEHHIQVPDAQALTKKIGAILLKAVA